VRAHVGRERGLWRAAHTVAATSALRLLACACPLPAGLSSASTAPTAVCSARCAGPRPPLCTLALTVRRRWADALAIPKRRPGPVPLPPRVPRACRRRRPPVAPVAAAAAAPHSRCGAHLRRRRRRRRRQVALLGRCQPACQPARPTAAAAAAPRRTRERPNRSHGSPPPMTSSVST